MKNILIPWMIEKYATLEGWLEGFNAAYQALMNDTKAVWVFTSPKYVMLPGRNVTSITYDLEHGALHLWVKEMNSKSCVKVHVHLGRKG